MTNDIEIDNIDEYFRKSFPVRAVQVTPANMAKLAKWCEGTIKSERRRGTTKKYIEVPVEVTIKDRQRQAFYGDWILVTASGYKVYNDKAFHDAFEKKPAEPIAAKVSNSGTGAWVNRETAEDAVSKSAKDAIELIELAAKLQNLIKPAS